MENNSQRQHLPADESTAEELQRLLADLGPEWHYAGSVAVDAGAVLVADAITLPSRPPALDPSALYEELPLSQNPAHTAVACRSGLGDGRYPVFVQVVDLEGWGPRVAELRVLFLPELQEVG